MFDLTVFLVTVLLIVLSAFFVVIEFSLIGARRHRLEAEASGNASARAALRGMNELTTMLAAAQLGITACTFGLGAVTKPSVEYWLEPILSDLGWPLWLAGGSAFAFSLLLVTFLHLVVGEMAPKSWAIANPELSAKVIGIASRVYLWPLRPFLNWVNKIANYLVRAVGVTPVNRTAVGGQDADTIRQVVEHSAQIGVLEAELKSQITEAIQLQSITAGDFTKANQDLAAVDYSSTIGELQDESRSSGHLRILVRDKTGEIQHVVHIRDTLQVPHNKPIKKYLRPVFKTTHDTPLHEMLKSMRQAGVQLALVSHPGGLQSVVTVKDIIKRLLPQGSPSLDA
jgi:CBS domain containing-hemolysin-like protein